VGLVQGLLHVAPAGAGARPQCFDVSGGEIRHEVGVLSVGVGPSGPVTTSGGLVLGHGVRALVHRVLVLVRGGCGLFGSLLGLGRLLGGSIGGGFGGRGRRCGVGLDRGVRGVGSGRFGLFLAGGGLGTGGLLLGRGGQQFALPLGQRLGLTTTGGVLATVPGHEALGG